MLGELDITGTPVTRKGRRVSLSRSPVSSLHDIVLGVHIYLPALKKIMNVSPNTHYKQCPQGKTKSLTYLDLVISEGGDEVCHGHDLGVLLVRLGLLAIEWVDLGLVENGCHHQVLENLHIRG